MKCVLRIFAFFSGFEIFDVTLPPSFVFRLVLVCFLISGATGLIYQVLWVRLIDKVIGSAPFAVATVLSVFMGGLALGSFVAGRYADRIEAENRLLALYGGLEIAIAAAALAMPAASAAAVPLYRLAYARLFDHFWGYQAVALAGCALLLIVPCGLMGATLPVLCRFFVRRLDHLGRRAGTLYGLNTVGGAAGAAVCGFLLIEALGMAGTLWLAAGLNLTLGTVCLALSRIAGRNRARNEKRAANRRLSTAAFRPDDQVPAAGETGQRWPALALFAVSGFCAMAYEVFWTRLLGLIIGPTTYSFTLVVTVFIVGLAAGSILFGRVADRSRSAFAWLAGTQMAAALLALAASQFIGNSQFFFAKLIAAFQGRFGALLAVQSLVLAAVLVGPTVFLGATFPLVNRIWTRNLSGLGASIGSAYAVNTVGAILGSLLAGFVLIPALGQQHGLRFVCALQFAAAGLAALVCAGPQPSRRRLATAAGLALAIGLMTRWPSWDGALLSRGWYRDPGPIRAELARASWPEAAFSGPDRLARHRCGIEVVFCQEGIGGFTTVEKEVTSPGTVEYALFNSGKPDASSHGDRSTQTLSAHFPMLFHPDPEQVMVLGLASGMTCGEVLHYPVRRLDILEINQGVARACDLYFGPWNNGCLHDPRTRLIVQDGRNHLALTGERYDVIISEPSNPWMAGLANLYTLDFFRLVKGRLTPQGIFAQWIQSYEMDWATFCLLGRTFAEVFPGGALIKIGPVDYLLLGAADGCPLDWETARRHLPYARKSQNATFTAVDLLAHLVVTEDLPGLFGQGPLHTDGRPRLEFAAPRLLHRGHLDVDREAAPLRRLSDETRLICDRHAGPEALLDLVAFGASANVPLFGVIDSRQLAQAGRKSYLEVVRGYCRNCPVPSYGIFNDAEARIACGQIHADLIATRLEREPGRAHDHYNLGLASTAAGRWKEAEAAFEKAVVLDPDHAAARTALGLICAEAGRFEDAAAHLERAAALDPQSTAARNALGRVLLARGRIDAAAASFAEAVAIDPADAESHHNLGTALFRQGRLREARDRFAEALRLAPENENARQNLEIVARSLAARTR